MPTIADLIEVLKTKDQTAEVEHLVLGTNGAIVAMNITSKQAKPIIKVLKMMG